MTGKVKSRMPRWVRGSPLVAFTLYALAFLAASPAWATTYYVDNCVNTGSDSYDGTEQTHTSGSTGPWLTIAHVNSQSFSAGDSILFQKTCTWSEQLTVPSSGSAGSVITIGAYGSGAAPILYGVDTYSGSWTTEVSTSSLSQTTGSYSTYSPIGDYSSENHMANAFTAAANETILGVTLVMRYAGTPGAKTITAQFYTDDGTGLPYTALGSASGALTESAQTWNGNNDVNITFTGMSATLVYGTEYHLVITRSSNDSTNYPKWTEISDTSCGAGSYYCVMKSSSGSSGTWGNYHSTRGRWTGTVASYSLYYYAPGYTPSGVFFDGSALKQTLVKGTLATGWWYWDSTNSRTYLYDNPSGHTVESGSRYGAYVNGKGYITITGMNIQRSVYGVALNGASPHATITNCTFSQTTSAGIKGMSTSGASLLVSGNSFTNNVYYGINLGGTGAGSGTESVIQNNTFSGNWQIAVSILAAYVIVQNNTFANNGQTWWPGPGGTNGILFNTGASYDTARYNLIYGTVSNAWDGAGIELAAGDHVSAYYNIIYGNYGACFEVSGVNTNFSFQNNTCYGNLLNSSLPHMGNSGARGEIFLSGSSGAQNATIENNAVYATTTGASTNKAISVYNFWTAGGLGLVISNNDWYSAGSNFYDWGGTDGNSLSTWNTDTGYSTDLLANPQFANPATDFHPVGGSPLLAAGMNLGLSVDYYGLAVPGSGAVTIGAIENAEWSAALSESNTASDALARSHGMFAAPSETNSASDSLARAGVFGRPESESNIASDALARLGAFGRGDSESNTASDSLAWNGVYGRTASESNTASDALARAGVFGRTDSESNTVSDALARLAAFARIGAESQPAADAIARLGSFGRAGSETHAASDALARAGVFGRADRESNIASDALFFKWTLHVLGRHAGSAPGKTKSGAVPGRTKTGTAPTH